MLSRVSEWSHFQHRSPTFQPYQGPTYAAMESLAVAVAQSAVAHSAAALEAFLKVGREGAGFVLSSSGRTTGSAQKKIDIFASNPKGVRLMRTIPASQGGARLGECLLGAAEELGGDAVQVLICGRDTRNETALHLLSTK